MSDIRRPFGLAVAQMGPVGLEESRPAVVRRLCELFREAAGRGARFVVFPELALTTFFPRYWIDEREAVARFFEASLPGPQTQPLFDLARERGMGFYLGYAELAPDGRRFNSSALVDATGTVRGRYRKIHLPGYDKENPEAGIRNYEKKFFAVGDQGFKVWSTQGTRIGMALCNDRRWPETFRVMGLQGAEIVALGYNTSTWNERWTEPPHLAMMQHLLSLQAGAYQNAAWVAAAAKAGSEDGFHLLGGSAIVSPTGEIVAQSQSDGDEVLFVNADLARGDAYRQGVFDFARHRRTEHYGLIVDRTGVGAPLGDLDVPADTC
ncbi:MAG: nitrilase-related carbon-nitrogen hydrolase [Burkholderiaceae bacterium]